MPQMTWERPGGNNPQVLPAGPRQPASLPAVSCGLALTPQTCSMQSPAGQVISLLTPAHKLVQLQLKAGKAGTAVPSLASYRQTSVTMLPSGLQCQATKLTLSECTEHLSLLHGLQLDIT